MDHAEYIRIVPGSRTAVLLIHGICGSPNQFRSLLHLEERIPAEMSVCNIVLDGHGKKVRDFSRTSMKKWKSQVWSVFEELCKTHEQVVLVAHSMGTLFSIQLSLEHPEKIPNLFLINVPLRVGLRPFGVRNILRVAFRRLDSSDPVQLATGQATGIAVTKKLWQYIPWLPRIMELLWEMKKTRNILGQISVPCLAFHSWRDELVSKRSLYLLEKSGRVRVNNLPNSTHFYYSPEDLQKVQEAFLEVCKQQLM